MANLAEAAASAVGADALLVRVGAYYHDLGKTVQPKYFVENLAPGEESPHDEHDPEISADAIMAHVVSGTKILREGGIPEPVVEFAYTHHGTQIVEYFWHKCVDAGNPKGLTEEHFRYPGMKPPTKETAILMLVDSIEAASRTIDPPERDKFEEMIQRIIFTKLRTGQLDDSGLTLSDLRILVTRMSDTLVNMFHHRIRYPWQEQRRVVTHFTTPLPGPVSSLASLGSFASLPPEGVAPPPSVPVEVGSQWPRDREPPPSIHVAPLSLVPPFTGAPPALEAPPSPPPSTAPNKKT
jgi:putative nucleotidyltransferase with HDIG domain